MARKYRLINDLGQCFVGLQGYSEDQRTRVAIAQQATTDNIFLVLSASRRQRVIPVTAIPPCKLLELMVSFTWNLDYWTVTEDKVEPQVVSGR